jgi:hypothetical protein
MEDSNNIFTYDKDLFTSLSKNDKNVFVKKFINNIVSTLNSDDLIRSKESPNENIIYHLYSDGTITRQKGGWAYGKRNVIDIKYECIRSNNFFTFPKNGNKKDDTYAILTIEQCNIIRDLMNELLLQI